MSSASKAWLTTDIVDAKGRLRPVHWAEVSHALSKFRFNRVIMELDDMQAAREWDIYSNLYKEMHELECSKDLLELVGHAPEYFRVIDNYAEVSDALVRLMQEDDLPAWAQTKVVQALAARLQVVKHVHTLAADRPLNWLAEGHPHVMAHVVGFTHHMIETRRAQGAMRYPGYINYDV